MNIPTLYECFKASTSLTTDSRACVPGAMFIALKGASFNGNEFAQEALRKGCRYVVVDEAEYALPSNPNCILVPDALEALQQLASYHRQQLATPIIGITGTNGKTTTKELIAAVLQERYHVHYTAGNLNNHIGVPLTLLQLTAEHELAVIEMGANHPGEIALLASIAQPDYGIITNVGKAHLEGFGSFEGVIKTKGELYDYLRTAGKHTIFVDSDNHYLTPMIGGLQAVTYGTNCSDQKPCDVCGSLLASAPYLCFCWKSQAADYHVTTQLVGAYNLQNALAAIAIGRYFEVADEAICTALQHYKPQNNRSQLVETATNKLIVDAYNANPTSMMAALQNFAQLDVPCRVVVLGDMRELGAYSIEEHQKIIDYLKTAPFERTILIGTEFSEVLASLNEPTPFEHYTAVEEFIEGLANHPITASTLLIKGSNGIKLNKVISHL